MSDTILPKAGFAGKVALVTGASRGIGKGIARGFARQGAKVAVTARDLGAAEAVAEALRADGGQARGFAVDVSDAASVRALAPAVAEALGGIDIAVANAGVFPSVSLEAMSADDWDQVMNINARSALFTLQACLPWLKRSPAPRFILTSSITGPLTGYPGWAHYAASKAAQLGFMRTAALELAPHRITVNAVLPGNIATEGLSGLGPAYIDKMAASIPLGRLGSVDDIAAATLFFASEGAAFVTGQTLVIDGGQTLPENLLGS
jgi:3-oxoacyl-[acyl-carrier protein] reductase